MFDLTNEQKDIRQAAREFAEKEFRDVARELDENEKFDDTIWKKPPGTGFSALSSPSSTEASASVISSSASSIEEFARIDGGASRKR